jgi:ABC-type Fe3+/spermidine/putrescine transport system ATPase subunit
MLDRVGLTLAERDRLPSRLSGGQQQRVALARALVIEPSLLLLDEPLANLDRQLREQLRGELKELHRRTGVTTVFVTHDREEALLLADRVGVLAAGRLLQAGDPQTVYRQPRCPYAARLLGEANLIAVESVAEASARLAGGFLWTPLPDILSQVTPGRLVLIRPEACLLANSGGLKAWTGRVAATSFLGADRVIAVKVAPAVTVRVRLRADAIAPTAGETVHVSVPAEAVWLIPERDPEGVSDVQA